MLFVAKIVSRDGRDSRSAAFSDLLVLGGEAAIENVRNHEKRAENVMKREKHEKMC